MSIRSVDMQHTLQQTNQVERVQAVDRSQVDQQAQQYAQQLDRTQALRSRTVVQSDASADSRHVDEERDGNEHGRKRRRSDHSDEAQAEERRSESPDGEIHLIDIRV